ncbi:MAG: DUF1015 family protein [Anaerotruncus sp.]|nr:DUF1015 family protein [Anaerotruncus sp.]
MPALYVADGHHRSAAATRIKVKRDARAPGRTGDEEDNFFLAVIFPHSQMKILPYNRVVRDLNGLEPAAFLARVGETFAVRPDGREGAGREPGVRHVPRRPLVRPRGQARQRSTRPIPSPRSTSPSCSANLLAPVLGIADPRTDKRIDFVGGIRGTAELEKKVAGGSFRRRLLPPPHDHRAALRRGRRRQDHAAQVDLVRAQAQGRPGRPHDRRMSRPIPAALVARVREEAGAFFRGARGSHDGDHTERVRRLCLRIGRKEKADLGVLELAALLHDIGRGEEDRSARPGLPRPERRAAWPRRSSSGCGCDAGHGPGRRPLHPDPPLPPGRRAADARGPRPLRRRQARLDRRRRASAGPSSSPARSGPGSTTRTSTSRRRSPTPARTRPTGSTWSSSAGSRTG